MTTMPHAACRMPVAGGGGSGRGTSEPCRATACDVWCGLALPIYNTYIYIYICICMYTNKQYNIYIYIYIDMQSHTYIYVYTYVYVYVYVYPRSPRLSHPLRDWSDRARGPSRRAPEARGRGKPQSSVQALLSLVVLFYCLNTNSKSYFSCCHFMFIHGTFSLTNSISASRRKRALGAWAGLVGGASGCAKMISMSAARACLHMGARARFGWLLVSWGAWAGTRGAEHRCASKGPWSPACARDEQNLVDPAGSQYACLKDQAMHARGKPARPW